MFIEKGRRLAKYKKIKCSVDDEEEISENVGRIDSKPSE